MRARKRNPWWGEGLDKRQARRARRRGRPPYRGRAVPLLELLASLRPEDCTEGTRIEVEDVRGNTHIITFGKRVAPDPSPFSFSIPDSVIEVAE